jgi:hypothetical protein
MKATKFVRGTTQIRLSLGFQRAALADSKFVQKHFRAFMGMTAAFVRRRQTHFRLALKYL